MEYLEFLQNFEASIVFKQLVIFIQNIFTKTYNHLKNKNISSQTMEQKNNTKGLNLVSQINQNSLPESQLGSIVNNCQKYNKSKESASTICKQAQKLKIKDKKAKQSNRWLVQWRNDEDKLLFQKYVEIGSKWVQLTKYFVDKSDNAIKNRFYSCLRKVQRKMVKVQKQRKINHRKPVSYQSLLTILQIGKHDSNIEDKRLEKIRQNYDSIMELRELIIEAAREPEQNIDEDNIQKLINKFLELKYSLKFINIHRVKNSAKKSSDQKSSVNQIQSTVDASHIIQEQAVEYKEEIMQSQQTNNIQIEDLTSSNKISSENSGLKQICQSQISLLESCQDILSIDLQEQKFNFLFFL